MRKHITGLLLAIPLMVVNSVANANTYHFSAINPNQNNISLAIAVGNQLTVDVTASGTTGAYFTFTNPVGISSSIVDVYFSDPAPTIFSTYSIFNQTSGVSFTMDTPNPANFPEGGPTFIEVASADATGSGTNEIANGINNVGESLTFLALFQGTYNFSNLIAALNSGDFRIGLQTRDNPTGGNPSTDRWLSNTSVNPVPLPAAAWLFGSALLGFVSLSNRRKV